MITKLTIAPGVTLRALQTDKFKTGCFSINFLRQHNKENAALDALLPSVLLRGTEKYPNIQQISMQLDKLYGATFGSLVRRKGEAKLFGFYGDFLEDCFVPGGGIFAGMLEFLDQILFHPITEEEKECFLPEYVEGEKQNLIRALESSINDKRSYAYQAMLQTMCAEEDYGVPRLGTVEDVESITPDRLWDHYQDTLRRCSIEIFYSGRLSPKDAAAAFASLFPFRHGVLWETFSTSRPIMPYEPREVIETMDVSQGKLVMGMRINMAPEDPGFIALNLLNIVFGSGMTSKLFVNVREKHSLCYYASSTYERYKGIFVISSGIASENYEIAKTAILDELEACKRGEITSEELEAARIQMLSALRTAMDVPNRLDDFFVGQAIAPIADLQTQMEVVKKLTVRDLSDAAKKLHLDTIYFLKGENHEH